MNTLAQAIYDDLKVEFDARVAEVLFNEKGEIDIRNIAVEVTKGVNHNAVYINRNLWLRPCINVDVDRKSSIEGLYLGHQVRIHVMGVEAKEAVCKALDVEIRRIAVVLEQKLTEGFWAGLA